MPKSYTPRALRYATKVIDGRIPACDLVRKACQRHIRDLEKSKRARYPFKFSKEKADRVCEFAERMIHIKGKWAERTDDPESIYIRLEDWQCFFLSVIFGWIRKRDGLRRFREVYAEIPRKNSKSTMGAIIGLYMALADGEPGAEVYSGATTLDQAMEVFRPAWLMVDRNPDFRKFFGIELGGTAKNPGNIYRLSLGTRFEPLIGKPGDGASPHCAIIDEYHEHQSDEFYETMKTGMGARTQPLRLIITTAGVNTSGPCYDKHLDAIKVLSGTQENDELFAIIYGLDEDDDWIDFRNWRKANPNFGVSVFEDYLRAELRDAMQNAGEQNSKRTKHLNQWMNAGKAWMNMVFWERQKDTSLHLEDFTGQVCWLGLDLANKIDIASLAFIFKTEYGFAFFANHYLPEKTIELSHNAHYRKWRDEGFLIQTDGARTDFGRIERDIKEVSNRYVIQELAFDPKEASYLIQNIQDWASFECIEIGQGPTLMSEPMKEMEAAIYAGQDPRSTNQLRHNGDPVLTWMMGNVVKKQGRSSGPVKYYYPTKEREADKIDGVVAGIMALSRAMHGADNSQVISYTPIPSVPF